ncbi:hypothetical protein V5799_020608 [Amblyomma americanum]|uniref:Secreted protein n=1 Tax=Amblyomma americanum TaxID=6943 RepID=A0AAQ4ETY3_AMBAM
MKSSLVVLALVVCCGCPLLVHGGGVPLFAAPLVAAPAVLAVPAAVSHTYSHKVHSPVLAAPAYPLPYVIG